MFEGWLKTKFYTKCKSLIKMMKTRIELIRRKRNAMQKFLKIDIIDLLKAGLDVNAYGRADGLLAELNLSSCYDLMEHFCDGVSEHLSLMSKERECPEECREMVSTLMFAAARFADLPELRDLRSTFAERYGNSLDAYANPEFVKKSKSTPPTKEMKLQLLQEIAQEAGLEWNPKALEQKLFNTPASVQRDRFVDTNADKYKRHGSNDESTRKIDNHDGARKYGNLRSYLGAPRSNEEDNASHGRNSISNDRYKLHSQTENNVPERTPTKDIHVDRYGQAKNSSLAKYAWEEEDDKKSGLYMTIPPPYSKSKVTKKGTKSEIPPGFTVDDGISSAKLNTRVNGEDTEDRTLDEANPKPRSVRSRLKPPPDHQKAGRVFNDVTEKMNINGKQQEETKRGPQITSEEVLGDEDEEEMVMERMMDRLLLHYSTKKSPSEQQGAQKETHLKQPLPPEAVNEYKKPQRIKNKDVPPARAISLPPEPATPSEATKGPARAASFQPSYMNPSSHVHPKLPDYDDFVARLAALRGK